MGVIQWDVVTMSRRQAGERQVPAGGRMNVWERRVETSAVRERGSQRGWAERCAVGENMRGGGVKIEEWRR